jgi:hypothetical protein
MRTLHALWIALLISVLPNLAAAQTASYSLNSTGVSEFGTGPYGSVTLTQSFSDVQVNVVLRNDLNFLSTGNQNSHSIFTFNVSGATAGDVTDISFANGLNGSFGVASPAGNSPFGNFTYGIFCTSSCTSGGSGGGYVVPLNFTVHNATISEFNHLSSGGTGAYFAADVLNLSGKTGAIGATVAAVPEPETYAMLLSGLGLIGFVARRRQQPASRV